MIIPWEEGQEEGPRASERIFLKYGTICFVKPFVFGTEIFIFLLLKTFVS